MYLFWLNKFNKFNKYLAIILLIFFNIFWIQNPAKTETINSNESIGLDYLDKEKVDHYILDSGDVLLMRFVKAYSINVNSDIDNELIENRLFGINDYKINGNGYLYLPRVGKVYVQGLTISELTKILDERFREFIKEPSIQIEITRYRPISVYIDGEVENTGLYVIPGYGVSNKSASDELDLLYQNNELDLLSRKNNIDNLEQFPKLFDLIRRAGGITIYSDLSNIEVIRNNPLSSGGGKIRTYVNLLDVIDKNDITQNIRILDGDRIIIKKSQTGISTQVRKAIASNLNPKFINIVVIGRVENGGKLSVSKSSSLNDAISLAGGLKVLKGPISLTRFKGDGDIERRKFRYSPKSERGSYKNPFLQTGDVINVGKGPVVKTAEVVGEVTSPFLGIYTTYSIIDDILN